MAIDLGAQSWFSPGDAALSPQSQVSVNDLSEHVTGGTSAAGTQKNSNAASSASQKQILYIAAGYVIGATILIVLLGGFVFKSANL